MCVKFFTFISESLYEDGDSVQSSMWMRSWQSGQVLSSPAHAPTVLMHVTCLLEEANGSVVVASQGVWR